MDMLIATSGLDHLPILTSILIGYVVDSKLSSFKMNVSHSDSPDFHALVHCVWNLVPHPRGDNDWFLWWELDIRRTVKFTGEWGRMLTCKHKKELWEAKWTLEEVRTLLLEDLHNITL